MAPRLSKEQRIARDLGVQRDDVRSRRRSLQLIPNRSMPSCSSLSDIPAFGGQPASSSNSERSVNAAPHAPRTPRQRQTEQEVSSMASSRTQQALTLDPSVFGGQHGFGTDHVGIRCTGGGHILESFLQCSDEHCACKLGCGDSRCQICSSAMKRTPSASTLAELALAGLQIQHRGRGRRYGPLAGRGEPTSSSGSERSLARAPRSRLPRTKRVLFGCAHMGLMEDPNAMRQQSPQLPPSDSVVSSQQSSRRPSITNSQISVEDLPFGHLRISEMVRRP